MDSDERSTVSWAVSALPPYLKGTLLLRGRTRALWTIALLLFCAAVTPWFLGAVGHSNALVAPLVLVLAWMWGRLRGAALGFMITVANGYWAHLLGVSHGSVSILVGDALAITAIAVLIGHIASVLESALGARARSDLAYTELEGLARDRMLTITDQVPVGLYRTTPDGAIVGGNDALMRILGFSQRDALLSANVWDHYLRSEDRHKLIGSAASEEGAWHEFQLRKADGSVIWVRDWARAVSDSENGTVHFDGVLEDITNSRTADERFRAAFEDSPIGMTISTVDGRMIKTNQAANEMLGRPVDEAVGLGPEDYSFAEDLEKTAAALDDVAKGKVVRYDKRLRRPDGSIIWVLITLAPIGGTESAPTHFISHVVDVTERRQAREALEDLMRSKDELIASVSHELRTPLTVVHGLAQELDSRWLSFSVPEQKEFIGLIALQSAEVAHIVEDLLVAARADIGKLPINAELVDLLGEVEQTLSVAPESKIDVARIGDVTPVAFADASRVRQIVRNLLSNAQRYGGPDVEVRCGTDGSTAWIEVVDDGDGIPDDEAGRIFQPYHRAHNAEGQPLSVGLGLTVALKLAQLMGGSLTYQYENGAAVFRLELPAAGSVHALATTRDTSSL
jgi:PAS domain S-box-containing protein